MTYRVMNHYVYILTNRSGTFYVGMTNDLEKRLDEHRLGTPGSFTARYKMDRLLYFEETSGVMAALEREKQLKGWTRKRKIDLIASVSPRCLDLSEEWSDVATLGENHQALRSAQGVNLHESLEVKG